MTKQTPRQRKALRSAAAKKGWQTRRDNEESRGVRMVISSIERERAKALNLPDWKQDELIWGRPIGIRNRVRAFWAKLVGR